MIWRSGTLRAGAAFALATYPAGQHLKFRIVARLPPAWTVVRVRAAAIRMQRLQQEAALVGVARDDQPGDRRERTPGFLIAPRLAVLRHGCEPDQPTRVRSEEHTSELQSRLHLVCRLLLEKKKK